jgi:hypothetical protein
MPLFEKTHRPSAYRCPVCHKRAEFGSHFCLVDEEALEEAAKRKKNLIQYSITASIACLAIFIFLYSMVGSAAAYFALAAIPACACAYFLFRRYRKRS